MPSVSSQRSGEALSPMFMNCDIELGGKWLRVRDHWWVTDPALGATDPPASEDELVELLRGNITTSALLILPDRVLLYAGQFYSTTLFHGCRNGRLMVTDNIRVLVADGYTLDASAIANYIFAKGFYFDQTPFAGVAKVSHGCLCRIAEGRVSERYLNFIKQGSEECTTERFLSLLEGSLGRFEGKKVMATLSGGLDSSFVAAFVNRHANSHLEGFHIFSSEGDQANRELEQARLLADSQGIALHELDFTCQRFIDTFPHFCSCSPLPFPNSGYRYYLLHRYGNLAVQPDYFVSGDASDTLFELSPDFYLFNKIHLFDRWVPQGFYEQADRVIDRSTPKARLVESLRWRTNNYLDFNLRLFHWKGTRVDYNGSWRDHFGGADGSEGLVERIRSRGMYDLDNRLYLLNTYFSYLELPIFVPLINGLFGAEYFTPFLDRDLIALALNLPSRKTKAKTFLKEAAAGYIPREIITRKKMGLVIPFRSWLAGAVRPLARELLLGKGGMVERGMIDEGDFRTLVDGFFEGKGPFGWCEIMALLSLEVWLRTSIDSSADAAGWESVSLTDMAAAQRTRWR